ncbi:MAG TPA: ankyrin repeat domain-containing protein [Chitinivibrionales bacterium]|nr:ankyrin repeat domain-containing protein [Chitinivibrionales bacterium]
MKSSRLRPLILTIPVLFLQLQASDETDSLLFQLVVSGPLTELNRCIDKCSSLNCRRPDGTTPLLAAVQANNNAAVGILLEHGADASLADTMHFDALYWALRKGHYQIADALLAHGVNVDRPNAQGNSPLMSAVMRGDLATAHYLLSRGADRKRKSASGQTPKAVAQRNRDTAMVGMLTSFTAAQPAQTAADTSADRNGNTFMDANEFFAAIQSGRRSFCACVFMGMDLKGMKLSGLNFQQANFSGCDLRGADMRSCDLCAAVLRSAYLHGADLRSAQVDSADFGGAMLTAADLRDAKGLTFDQLRSAQNLFKTKMDDETLDVMKREYPKHFKDPGGAWHVEAVKAK